MILNERQINNVKEAKLKLCYKIDGWSDDERVDLLEYINRLEQCAKQFDNIYIPVRIFPAIDSDGLSIVAKQRLAIEY